MKFDLDWVYNCISQAGYDLFNLEDIQSYLKLLWDGQDLVKQKALSMVLLAQNNVNGAQ